MGVSVIQNPNRIKGWKYLGSTTGGGGINIPDSYTDVFCYCYIDGNASQTISFFEIVNYTDERTYRSGYYNSSSSYAHCAIHSSTNGNWQGWVAQTNNGDKITTSKFFWFAR